MLCFFSTANAQFTEKRNISISDMSYYGVSYSANVDYFDKGSYALTYQFFGEKGFGGTFSIGSNMGLIDIEYASTHFRVGPTYGYACTENLFVAIPLTFVGTFSNPSGSTGEKFEWGTAITPMIGIKLDKFRIYAGGDMVSSKFFKNPGWCLMLGAGFNL